MLGFLGEVDALCIDQTNITERGQQVNMMAQIYGNAEEVIVWLGKSSNFTKKAASFLASLPSFTEGNDRRLDQYPGEHRAILCPARRCLKMLTRHSEDIRRNSLRSCSFSAEPGLKECGFYKRQCWQNRFHFAWDSMLSLNSHLSTACNGYSIFCGDKICRHSHGFQTPLSIL